MKEFWVKYDFEEDCNGRYVPNLIRGFATKEEADEFVKTTADGKVVEVKFLQC